MDSTPYAECATTRGITGAFFEVYNRLGFGFMEGVYASALERKRTAPGQWWNQPLPPSIPAG